MSFSKYEVIIPLSHYYEIEGEKQNTCDMIKEILLLDKKLPIVTIDQTQYLPIISYINEHKVVSGEILNPVPALKLSFALLSILPLYRDQYNKTNDKYMRDGMYAFSRHTQAAIIQNEVFYFLCITQIAYPFSIETYSGEIYVDGEFYLPIHSFKNPFKFWFDQDPKRLNTFRKIPLERVYNWIANQEITFNRNSKNNIEKLFFGLTQIYYAGEDEQKVLFWSMYALEAFYCKSSQNVTEQLRERIKLFLNDPMKFPKKTIQKMYDYRSAFIHGTTHIFPAGFNEDFINFTSPKTKEVNIHLRTSLSIILCTMQKLVALNLETVTFETTHVIHIKSKSTFER